MSGLAGVAGVSVFCVFCGCWADAALDFAEEEDGLDAGCGCLVGADAFAARAAVDFEELALLPPGAGRAVLAATTVTRPVVPRHIGPCCGSRKRGIVDIVFEAIE